MRHGPLTLLVNPSSGGGRAADVGPRVAEALRTGGWTPRVVTSRSAQHVEDVAAGTAGALAVLGGDGTVGRALAGARRSGADVAPLPGGRGNDLCRALGITGRPERVVAGLASWQPRRIDLGRVGERTFAGVLSAGFDAEASRLANATRAPGGSAYVVGALRALLGATPARLRVTVDGESREHAACWFCSVSNSGWYGAGKNVAPAASLEDGLLDVVVVEDHSRAALVPVLLGLFTGAHVRHPAVTVRTGQQVRVELLTVADRWREVCADGEAVASLPVEVTVDPGAVTVWAPPRG